MPSKLFRDKQFFQTMIKLATPIALQHFVMAALSVVDVVMIGQLGETAVASVGLADQLFFLHILLMFGIGSGAAIFTAQFWGKRDMPSIHAVLGLCLMMSLAGGVFWAAIAFFMPEFVLSIYSEDAAVIAGGSAYLRLVSLSYIAVAITTSYGSVLRSIERPTLPMAVSWVALGLNTLMNYALIFGKFGFPAWGIEGAAIATLIARFLECFILVGIVYGRRLSIAAPLSAMLNVPRRFLGRFFQITMPVIITELAWSFGITTYNVVYARIGTEAIAAINIAVTVERLALVLFIGLGNAAAIMIGNRIGARELDKASTYAHRILIIGPLGSVMVSLLVLLSRDGLLDLYQISDTTIFYTHNILTFMALVFPIKILAFMIFIGVLRSGGDTRFAMVVDGGAVWLIGVPLAFWAAFVLELPVYWVYLIVITEEVIKAGVGLWRILSNRWIHHLAEPVATH